MSGHATSITFSSPSSPREGSGQLEHKGVIALGREATPVVPMSAGAFRVQHVPRIAGGARNHEAPLRHADALEGWTLQLRVESGVPRREHALESGAVHGSGEKALGHARLEHCIRVRRVVLAPLIQVVQSVHVARCRSWKHQVLRVARRTRTETRASQILIKSLERGNHRKGECAGGGRN